MKDLNQIQKALEVKAKSELTNIVDPFIKSIKSIQDKHSGKSFFYIRSIQNTEKYLMCNDDEFRQMLINSLVERHSESIVETKTKELLDKLELI